MNYVSIFREGQQQLATDVASAEAVIPLSADVAASEFELQIPDNELRVPRRVPVRFEQVGDLPIDKMLSMESVPEYHIPEAHCMGYRCRLCGKSDESLGEVEHEDCELASEFDYQAHAGGVDVFRAIIRADHDLLILEAGGTAASGDGPTVRRGVPVHAWCAECSSGDDECDRIEHSEVCSLSRANLGLDGEEHGHGDCRGRDHLHADD